jgi:hypothetical protein
MIGGIDLELDALTNRARKVHAFERRVDNLHRAASVQVVWRFGFEQLGVCEDDPELVVQLMKQALQICRVEGLLVTPKGNLGHAEQCVEAHAAGVAEAMRD